MAELHDEPRITVVKAENGQAPRDIANSVFALGSTLAAGACKPDEPTESRRVGPNARALTVLALLDRAGDAALEPGSIAKELGVSTNTVYCALHKLREKRHVEAADVPGSRIKAYRLTAAGRHVLSDRQGDQPKASPAQAEAVTPADSLDPGLHFRTLGKTITGVGIELPDCFTVTASELKVDDLRTVLPPSEPAPGWTGVDRAGSESDSTFLCALYSDGVLWLQNRAGQQFSLKCDETRELLHYLDHMRAKRLLKGLQ